LPIRCQDSANIPDPDVLSYEIIEGLQAALEAFCLIDADHSENATDTAAR